MQLIEKWINAFFNGYGTEINSYVPSTEWIAADSKRFKNINMILKAKKILDKLGYKDKDGDGFRRS